MTDGSFVWERQDVSETIQNISISIFESRPDDVYDNNLFGHGSQSILAETTAAVRAAGISEEMLGRDLLEEQIKQCFGLYQSERVLSAETEGEIQRLINQNPLLQAIISTLINNLHNPDLSLESVWVAVKAQGKKISVEMKQSGFTDTNSYRVNYYIKQILVEILQRRAE